MIRKRFVLGGAGTFVACSAGIAANLPRLAIAVESDDSASEAAARRMLNAVTGQILRSGKFTIVDRNRLSTVIKEQGFSNSAYADPKTAAQLGKLVGASRILTITLTIDANTNSGAFVNSAQVDVSASFSLVAVDSGQVLNAGSAQGTGERQASAGGDSSVSGSQLEREGIDACAQDLASQITGN